MACEPSIDASGRIVVPKSLRDALGFRARQALEVWTEESRLEIELAPASMRLEKRGKGMVAAGCGKRGVYVGVPGSGYVLNSSNAKP